VCSKGTGSDKPPTTFRSRRTAGRSQGGGPRGWWSFRPRNRFLSRKEKARIAPAPYHGLVSCGRWAGWHPEGSAPPWNRKRQSVGGPGARALGHYFSTFSPPITIAAEGYWFSGQNPLHGKRGMGLVFDSATTVAFQGRRHTGEAASSEQSWPRVSGSTGPAICRRAKNPLSSGYNSFGPPGQNGQTILPTVGALVRRGPAAFNTIPSTARAATLI